MKIDSENKRMLQTLKNAATEALEKKRRLEQYAVMWRNDQLVIIENNDVQAKFLNKKISRDQPA